MKFPGEVCSFLHLFGANPFLMERYPDVMTRKFCTCLQCIPHSSTRLVSLPHILYTLFKKCVSQQELNYFSRLEANIIWGLINFSLEANRLECGG